MSEASRIADALGGGRRFGRNYLVSCPVSGHGKGAGDKQPSLRISDGDKALLVKCYGGCPTADILAELRARGLLHDHGRRHRPPDPMDVIRRKREDEERRQKGITKAQRLWGEGASIESTLAEQYLRARAIIIPLPNVLRFHPELPFWHDVNGKPRIHSCWPAMLAVIEDETGVVAVQRTYLDPSGRGKAKLPDGAKPKLTYGPKGAGAVRLGPVLEELGIAEGTETALSAKQLYGGTVWASCGSPKSVALPDEVKRVIIYGDNDDSGHRMANEAAVLFSAQGHKVWLSFPDEQFDDFNTALRLQAGGLA